MGTLSVWAGHYWITNCFLSPDEKRWEDFWWSYLLRFSVPQDQKLISVSCMWSKFLLQFPMCKPHSSCSSYVLSLSLAKSRENYDQITSNCIVSVSMTVIDMLGRKTLSCFALQIHAWIHVIQFFTTLHKYKFFINTAIWLKPSYRSFLILPYLSSKSFMKFVQIVKKIQITPPKFRFWIKSE